MTKKSDKTPQSPTEVILNDEGAGIETPSNIITPEIGSALMGLTVSKTDSSEMPARTENIRRDYDLRILMALRRIMHFIDAYSRRLAVEQHITGPQLICLYAIVTDGPLTLSDLGKRVSLSMSTTNGIVDRLENKNLILRERKDKDRRKVLLTATQAGIALATKAPLPLQDRLSLAIAELPELEQVSIALSLERIVEMMEERT